MRIGIVGLGFVGLSFAAVLGSKKYHVVGIDTDRTKILKIKNGKAPFHEPDLDSTIRVGLKNGLIVASDFAELSDCDFIFITVGTPQQKDGSIDLTMIKSATKDIGRVIKRTTKKPTVIVKSTVIPETTQNTVLPILEDFLFEIDLVRTYSRQYGSSNVFVLYRLICYTKIACTYTLCI